MKFLTDKLGRRLSEREVRECEDLQKGLSVVVENMELALDREMLQKGK